MQGRNQVDNGTIVNIVHCCPEGLPERVFRELSYSSSSAGTSGEPLLADAGWIAVYGPFLSDDGTYKSLADEQVRPPNLSQGCRLMGIMDSSTRLGSRLKMLDWD